MTQRHIDEDSGSLGHEATEPPSEPTTTSTPSEEVPLASASAPDAETPDADPKVDLPPADRIIVELTELLDRQRSSLRHVRFLQNYASKIEDLKSVSVDVLTYKYPLIEPETLWQAVQEVLRLIHDSDSGQIAMEAVEERLRPVAQGHDARTLFMDVFQSIPRQSTMQQLYAAQLTSLVADFEYFCGSILRIVAAELHRDIIPPGKKLDWQRVEAAGSVSALREELLEEQISALLRKGLSSWIGAFKSLKVRIPTSAQDGPNSVELHEVFNRRHVIIHNGGRVSSSYISRMSQVAGQCDAELGALLQVSPDYLTQAADVLIEVAFGLATNCAMTLIGKDREFIENRLVNLIYHLLVEKRPDACRRVCTEYRDTRFKDPESGPVVRVNGWLAMRELGQHDQVRQEVDEWDVSDLPEAYKLAKLILQEDWGAATALARRLLANGGLSPQAWNTWPLAAPLRDRGVGAIMPA